MATSEMIPICQVWILQYNHLKKASTKAKKQIWLETYSEIIKQL